MLAAMIAIAASLAAGYGGHRLGQVTVNGLVAGTYLALGAVSLTLLYGVLRIINFAHGEYMTVGAYVSAALAAVGLPFPAAAAGGALGTGAASIAIELGAWGPLRRRGAKALQTLLAGIAVSLIVRYAIQLIAGPKLRALDVDVTSSYSLAGFTIGRTELITAISGYVLLLALALALKYSWPGKQLRALSDSRELAETCGFDTRRLTFITQIVAGVLAGLAGVLFGVSLGAITPDFGFIILLNLFAAAILGGLGSVFGALAAGVLLGLAQEWSTLVVGPQWKLAVSFVVLIAVLLVRPEGMFARRMSVR